MNSVAEKKQGRRSAKEAELTKKEILKVSAQLFCQHGYKKVSLRQISEQAGVSHSLLRYHFGSKEKIWQHISDHIYQYFQDYFQYIIDSLPQNLPANVQLYMLMNRVLACSLNDSRAITFLADAVRQEKKMVNYFLEPSRKNNQLIDGLIQAFKQEHPESLLTAKTLRWQASMYSHAASTLDPLMLHAFECDDRKVAIFSHWKQFSQLLAIQLHIAQEYIETPNCLEDMIVTPPVESTR
ncbi:TetR/AcrR family transcriptional regulator [Vibrio rumoiensis]|uniref:TetR/AcrR family transcriptional regulator n=1 Tax=Vibrio rumoiensis TaxID=76258 RepID=A0ABW7IXI9_9VIBR|nr:TetR/AcrR family transcriptional regulator [Vibrio rumoiensis]